MCRYVWLDKDFRFRRIDSCGGFSVYIRVQKVAEQTNKQTNKQQNQKVSQLDNELYHT